LSAFVACRLCANSLPTNGVRRKPNQLGIHDTTPEILMLRS
jgi:hypothetical protein